MGDLKLDCPENPSDCYPITLVISAIGIEDIQESERIEVALFNHMCLSD